jgi:hypothetical protein
MDKSFHVEWQAITFCRVGSGVLGHMEITKQKMFWSEIESISFCDYMLYLCVFEFLDWVDERSKQNKHGSWSRCAEQQRRTRMPRWEEWTKQSKGAHGLIRHECHVMTNLSLCFLKASTVGLCLCGSVSGAKTQITDVVDSCYNFVAFQ